MGDSSHETQFISVVERAIRADQTRYPRRLAQSHRARSCGFEWRAAGKSSDKGPVMKMAPVQGYSAGIPWEMHLRAYDVYCKRYGAQPAMIEGWCRGGFGDTELDIFIPGWREELSERTKLFTLLREARVSLETAHGYESADVHGNPLPWGHKAKQIVEAIREIT